MYAVVRRYSGVTDPDEAGRRVEDQFVDILREVPGFVAYYWVDAGDGVMLSTSVFDTEPEEEESTKRAGEFVHASLESLLPNPPEVTAGHVVASS
jgi:hypothetical protein